MFTVVGVVGLLARMDWPSWMHHMHKVPLSWP